MFLSWQRDPTTTMTVQWVGPSIPDDTTLRYVSRTGDAWKSARFTSTAFPKTDFKVHRTELTGLTPGTEYLFQIGKDSPVMKFRTMPAKATDTFPFVSGGDCGTGPHAIGTNMLAAKQEPQFALIGGDLGYDNGRSPGTAIKFLRNYAKHMVDPKGPADPAGRVHRQPRGRRRLQGLAHGCPLLLPPVRRALPGDHLRRARLRRLPEPGPARHRPHLADRRRAGRLARGTLRDREERPHLIAVNHVPAYPSVRDPGTAKDGKLGTGEANRQHWCPLFERYSVDVVLEHHDHTFKRTSSAHRRVEGSLRRSLSRRRFVGSNPHAQHAAEAALSRSRQPGVSHDRSPPRRRSALSRRSGRVGQDCRRLRFHRQAAREAGLNRSRMPLEFASDNTEILFFCIQTLSLPPGHVLSRNAWKSRHFLHFVRDRPVMKDRKSMA